MAREPASWDRLTSSAELSFAPVPADLAVRPGKARVAALNAALLSSAVDLLRFEPHPRTDLLRLTGHLDHSVH